MRGFISRETGTRKLLQGKHDLKLKPFRLFSERLIRSQDAEDACYREYLFDRTFRPPMCNITKEVCQYNIDNHEGGLLALAEQWTHQVCFRGALWDENCTGHINHGVCTLAWDDLTLMRDKFCMIANKFDSGIDANAIMCMVKDIRGLTRDYQKGVPQNGV